MASTSQGTAEPSPPATIRLLLHAVDGLVPYLTPQLLRKCFPIERVRQRLWIGMAVKDTCIVPTFKNDNDAQRNHPRGYTLQACPPDAWMVPFTRLSVPTFDVVADAAARNAKDVAASDQHVLLWTGNGRQPASPEQYAACALGGPYAVPLFDAAGSGGVKKKRWLAALKRTQAWSLDFCKRSAKETTGILFPILLKEEMEDQGIEDQLQFFLDNTAINKNNKDMGLVLIGWNYLPENLQIAVLEQAKVRLPGALLGMLATQSLTQVIRAACHGATLIGSNLPQQWALQKQAFLFDLETCWNERDVAEPPSKRVKTDESAGVSLNENACLDLHPPYDQVQEHPWYRDKRPLLPQCTCHTCQTHSRAYIYHLVCAKEMLAEVLLFIHNLHHLLEVLECVEKMDSEKRAVLLGRVQALSKVDSSTSDQT